MFSFITLFDPLRFGDKCKEDMGPVRLVQLYHSYWIGWRRTREALIFCIYCTDSPWLRLCIMFGGEGIEKYSEDTRVLVFFRCIPGS